MLRSLSDTQTVAFDSSQWDRQRFERWMQIDEVEVLLSPYIADHPEARLLDLGGGTGRFADALLTHHESCSVVVGDSSESLLSRNQPNPRKATFCLDATRLAVELEPQSFDVVFVHRLLHHLVGDSYGESIRLIQSVLCQCWTILKPGGRLSLIENVWDGRFVDGLASRLLYSGTSSRVFRPITCRLGANTAGVGVCYLSDRVWGRLLRRAGFHVESRQIFGGLRFPWYIRHPTLLKKAQSIHYWCERT